MRYFTKFLFNKSFKRFFILFLLLLIYIFISAISYTNAVCTNISDSVFRLHVIANSDSPEDQNLKYVVRDAVTEFIKDITKNSSSKDDVINIVENNLAKIESIALNTIYEQGYDYSIKISIGNFSFPTKHYGDISLPSGFYDALKIEIGNAEGQNWWCVMFPPLCFVDTSTGIVPDESKEILKENMQEEEFKLISETTTELKIKFKFVEVLQNLNLSGIFM